ncbi:MAG TPA: AbrB/MazE/SpoVT family DNA-binding domain-containing protein [Bacillota bacterium]|nr:AbrB/MazE/SpoVT family DNA-binding domain-containing protein [Bacillota bacterium]
MKPLGIVRKVDILGRVVIPKELRTTLDIAEKDPIEIYVEDEKIILKKYNPTCVFCGSVDNVLLYKDKLVCETCAKAIADHVKND